MLLGVVATAVPATSEIARARLPVNGIAAMLKGGVSMSTLSTKHHGETVFEESRLVIGRMSTGVHAESGVTTVRVVK